MLFSDLAVGRVVVGDQHAAAGCARAAAGAAVRPAIAAAARCALSIALASAASLTGSSITAASCVARQPGHRLARLRPAR